MATISLSLPSDGQTIDAADVNTPFNTISAVINGNLDNDNIATAANISGTKLGALTTPLTVLDANGRGGWITGLTAPTSITALGNRSYSIVHPASVATYKTPGFRNRYIRTVTAPTQCADLEASSSQYFSKTTPAGMTFITTFTVMGWVKPESYVQGGIIARRNGDTEGFSLAILATGQIYVAGLRIAGNRKDFTSYQSVSLNKWTHVAVTVDMTAGSTSGGTWYIDGVSVPGLVAETGTATALVQGTTALVVGAEKSAGTNPFDGKIAQAAVFSSVLSAATIRSYMSQGLSGAESTNVSAFSLNNTLNDLNANANNLTAQGSALATNLDTPFTQTQVGITTGTENYSITTLISSDGLTETVQVPEGCAIPTSGGVSAVSYSTQKVPYGFPNLDRFKITVPADTLEKSLIDAGILSPIVGCRLTNAGNAGGTMYYSNYSGKRELNADSATQTTLTTSTTFTFTVPSGLFNTVFTCTAVSFIATASFKQNASINSYSTTSVGVNLWSDVNATAKALMTLTGV